MQLYIHDRVASRVRPVRELKDFRKVALQPGESAEVVFTLTREQLAFTGRDGVLRASRASSTCGSVPRRPCGGAVRAAEGLIEKRGRRD